MKNLKLDNKKYFFSKKSDINKFNLFILFLAVLIIFSLYSQSAFAFSNYEEDVAASLYDDLDQKYRITEFSSGSMEYQVLKRLEANIIEPDFRDEEFKVHHVDDKLINAYYIGAGNIMLFDGLLQELNTEVQLAALIAHEMGHGVEEHLTEDLKRNLGLSLLNVLFNHFTDNEYQTMTNVAQNLIANGYSREQEEEADIYAVDLMMRAGYDPEGLIELMKIFKEKSHNLKLLEFTQTHPIPDSRIEYLEEYIAEKKLAEQKADNNRNLNNNENNNDSDKKLNLPRKLADNNLAKKFNNNLISFSYPENWNFEEQKINNSALRFKYQLLSDKIKGELYLEDLSEKRFMETPKKLFNYAAIKAEEDGYRINKSTIIQNNLATYRLESIKGQEKIIEYFIEKDGNQQLLKFKFIITREETIDQEELISQVIVSLKFVN